MEWSHWIMLLEALALLLTTPAHVVSLMVVTSESARRMAVGMELSHIVMVR